MKINSTLLLSGAFIIAGIIALVVRSQLSTPPVVHLSPPPAEIKKTAVLVAAKALYPGDFIDASAIRWEETEQPVTRSFYFIRDKDRETPLYGATLREKVSAGTPLTSNLLVRPGEPGFVAAVISPGMRAISIPTNAVASNAGLVSAGDRVDIILSLRRDEQPQLTPTSAQPLVPPVLAAQTIVRNLRVLALNNQTETEVRPRQDVDGDATRATPGSRTTRAPAYQTVTVEATPEQAEVLAVAKEVGLLHLALRSATAGEEDEALAADGARVTTLADSTRIYSGFSHSGHQVKIFRGDKKEIQQFPSR